jgi:hypothetical protein
MSERTKICRLCGEAKAISDFYAMKGMRDGYRNECKRCHLAARKAKYDSAAAVARAKAWAERNPERVAAYRQEYRNRPETRRKMRDLYYRRTYGITADEFDAMLAAQGGVCIICAGEPNPGAVWHLDHDHVTGEIRGITCIDCNHGMGKLRDDPDLLERAAAYIRAHRAGGEPAADSLRAP